MRTRTLIKISIVFLSLLTMADNVGSNRIPKIAELNEFLMFDQTNTNNYSLEYYNCYNFTIDLAKNASILNITLGGAILADDYNFSGELNHAINYQYNDGDLIFIEPQTDEIISMDNIYADGYRYIKLYPNYNDTPKSWYYNDPEMTPDIIINFSTSTHQ